MIWCHCQSEWRRSLIEIEISRVSISVLFQFGSELENLLFKRCQWIFIIWSRPMCSPHNVSYYDVKWIHINKNGRNLYRIFIWLVQCTWQDMTTLFVMCKCVWLKCKWPKIHEIQFSQNTLYDYDLVWTCFAWKDFFILLRHIQCRKRLMQSIL